MNYKSITKNTYDEKADQISARFALYFSKYREEIVDEFLKRLEGNVLDIGCGSGDAAAYMKTSKEELNIVGIDISSEMLKSALKKDVTVILMDMEKLAFKPKSFDGVWAMNSLLHLPKQYIPNVLQQIYSVLKPKGSLFVSLKEGVGERFVTTQGSEKRYYSFWGKEEFSRLLDFMGFRLTNLIVTNRDDTSFLNYYAEKK